LMTLIGFGTDLWWMRLLMFTMGLSMAQVFISSQAASFATISHADTGQASSLFNSERQLGSAIGVAILSTVLAAVGTEHVARGHLTANLAAYHVAFMVAAGIAVLGSLVALTISDADAANTMVRHSQAKANAKAQSDENKKARIAAGPGGELGSEPSSEPTSEPSLTPAT
jgi:sugar phosphate permease